jgi:hypothetical protein
MATVDQYARCVADRTTSPPLTSGDTLHWDGLGAVSRVWRPQKEALSPAPALRCSLPASEELYPMLSPISSAIDWGSKAATVTFYLAPVLLRDAYGALPGVVGVLLWVRREEHAASFPPQYPRHCLCMLSPQLSPQSTSSSYHTSTPVILCSTTLRWCCKPQVTPIALRSGCMPRY